MKKDKKLTLKMLYDLEAKLRPFEGDTGLVVPLEVALWLKSKYPDTKLSKPTQQDSVISSESED